MGITASTSLSGIVGCLCIFFLGFADANCNPTCLSAHETNPGFSCNETTSECLHGCQQGYVGERCQFRCDDTCLNCTTENCNGDCNVTCYNGRCYQNETCIQGCLGGFYSQNCSLPCPEHCLNSACGRENGTCLFGCEGDFFGDTCETTCSPNCEERSGNQTGFACNVTTLNCLYGCKGNFKGDRCDTCNRKWTGPNCTVDCDYNCLDCQPDGACDRCYPGYFVMDKRCDQCMYSCYQNGSTIYPSCGRLDGGCVPVCDQVNGDCTFGCIPGTYGRNCYPRCSYWCIDRLCDRNDGCCTKGCKKSSYGGCRCEERCSSNCMTGTCYQNKTCMEGCVVNHWGPECNQECSDNCTQGKNKSISVCYMNGVCVFGCDKTFMGPDCLDRCPENCVERDCDRTSAQCLQGCEKGYWGYHCNSSCNLNCLDADCTYENGYCQQGCINGFHGRFCSRDCPINCLHSSCFKENGTCSKGCVKGLTGDDCNYVEVSSQEASSSSSLKTILDPVFYTFAGLVLVGMALILFYIKRKRVIKCCRKKVKCFDPKTKSIPSHIYVNSMQSDRPVQLLNYLPASENVYDQVQEQYMNAGQSCRESKSSRAEPAKGQLIERPLGENAFEFLPEKVMTTRGQSYGQITQRTSTNKEETATNGILYEELQKQSTADIHLYGDATESSIEMQTGVEASNTLENASVYQPLQIQTGTTDHVYGKIDDTSHTTKVSETKSRIKAEIDQEVL